MKYLINKIKKKVKTQEGIEYIPVVLFAEADSLLEATSRTVSFIQESMGIYEINDGGFFIAQYRMEEPVEVLIK